MAINWVGKDKSSDRVGRGSSMVDLSEKRWLVPVRPYQPPKGSREELEISILIGIGIFTVLFGLFIINMSAMC